MVNYGFLKRLMVVGEKNVMSQLVEFTELGTKSSELLEEMLTLDLSKMNEINDKIRDIEKAGDDLTLKIKYDITSGAISSNMMDNLMTLVDLCDDILDKSYFISRELKRMNYDYKIESQSTYTIMKIGYKSFREMLERNKEALDLVREMLESTDIRNMKEIRLKIEVLEEEVDEMKDDLIDEIYRNAGDLPYIVFSHLRDLVHKIDDMLDDCEDISDLVQTITLSVTK